MVSSFFRSSIHDLCFNQFPSELDTVYSKLDPKDKINWDILETLFQNGDITYHGYDHYVQLLLQKYDFSRSEWDMETKGDMKNKDMNSKQTNNTQSEIDLCKIKVEQLKKENDKLKTLLQIGSTINKTTEL